jgi:polysaccharide biosynthesis protein PslH
MSVSQTKLSTSFPRFRVLFLSPFAPQIQAGHGGGRVIAQLIAQLGQRHAVALCYLRSATEPVVDHLLRERCDVIEEILIPEVEDSVIHRWSHRLSVWKDLIAGKPLWAIDRFSPAFDERLRTLLQTWRPDIVQIEFHVMGQYLPALRNYPAPRILVEHEPGVESSREIMKSALAPGRIMPHLDLFAWKRFERKITKHVQAVVVFTERDRKALKKLGLRTPIIQIALGTEIPEQQRAPSENDSAHLLFVGNFKHLPNLDAADRLVNRIFPLVQSQVPNARLVIVGAHLPSNVLQTSNENITLTGYVPDLTPYLDRATLIAVPLRWGGGMRVKVLEALAAGKALVASSRAVEGLDLVDGAQVVLAESDDEFVRAIVDLLQNPQRRLLLAAQARAWASKHLSWERVAEEYEKLYRDLLKC